MKIPWRKKVKFNIDNVFLTVFIKDILTKRSAWKYSSMFQELTLDLSDVDVSAVRRNILIWLVERSR